MDGNDDYPEQSFARSESFPHDCLGLNEAAALLRLGVDATRELINAGALPALSLNRKHLVILRADVISFIRDTARAQQNERKARLDVAWRSAEIPPEAEFKPGRRRHPTPAL